MNNKDLYNKIEKMFSNIVLKGGSIIPESNEYYVISLLFAMIENINYAVDATLKEQNIETACCSNLYVLGANLGIYPKHKNFPTVIIKLTGKCGVLLSQNLTFQFQDLIFNSVYVYVNHIDNMPRLNDKGEAFVFAEIRDYTLGTIDIQKGAKGKLLEHILNVNTEVELISDVCPGHDTETCEQFRNRLLDLRRYKKHNIVNIIQNVAWDFPCLSNLTVIENADCCSFYNKIKLKSGCIVVLPNFNNIFKDDEIPKEILEMLEIWLFGYPNGSGRGKAPIGVCGYVLKTVLAKLKINIIFEGRVPFISELKAINTAIVQYINNLPLGSTLRNYDIERITYDLVNEMDINSCIEFSQDKSILNISKSGTVTAACDVKIIPDIHFYNSEGSEILL